MPEHRLVEQQAPATLGDAATHLGAARTATAAAGQGVVCRLGDQSRAAAHAANIGRSAVGRQASLHRSLMHLQRQFGNRHVGQVLRAVEGGAFGDLDGVERSIEQARGGGHGMDQHTQARMEHAFGADFSGVRIHTDARADSMSQALSARAFTTGQDVFFRQGEYNPGASDGRELLAHELTHVVQQTGGLHRAMSVSDPDDPLEREAEEMARALMRNEHAPPAARGPQRQPETLTAEEDEERKRPEGAPVHRQALPAPMLPEPDEDAKEDGAPQQADRASTVVSRTAETRALPKWGSSYFNKSSMTLNPFARLTVDGKVVRDDWGLNGATPATFVVPKCAKSGEVLISVTGYWFQNNILSNNSGEGTATIRTAFDVNEKGEAHFKPATANVEAAGTAAQMTASASVADNPPKGGSLVTQVAIASTDQTGTQVGVERGVQGGVDLPPVSFGGSSSVSTGVSTTTPSGNVFARGYRADVTVEKKVGVPTAKSASVFYKVGKHQIIGSRDPGQPVNIRQIYAFLNALPKDVRKELEDGSGDKKAKIEVLAQASVTTPHNPAAGFNIELTEKRRDSVVRLLQNFLGGGAKIKAKALGELEATDPGEAGYERVATITVSWEDDPCDAAPTQAP